MHLINLYVFDKLIIALKRNKYISSIEDVIQSDDFLNILNIMLLLLKLYKS